MRTKIICSIGPASASEEMIERLIENGMDIARLNFSHDSHEAHKMRIERVRKIAKGLNKKVEILCDLQGPKIRVQEFTNYPIHLCDNDNIVLTTPSEETAADNEIVIEDPYLHTDVKKKDVILIDDGQIELSVTNVAGHKIYCNVIRGCDLYPRKGVSLPFTETTTSALTDKDKKDLKFILTLDPEWVAISFVQNKQDILNLRELIGKNKARVMCKIERAKAIDNINDIIAESDGIMVARGDLGVEIPFQKLPIIQKQIIKRCNYVGKPVVTATQMLASMTKASIPTRAEVSDIANAVFDGTDAVMMSNETTVGQYPVESLQVMREVVRETEDYLFHRKNVL